MGCKNICVSAVMTACRYATVHAHEAFKDPEEVFHSRLARCPALPGTSDAQAGDLMRMTQGREGGEGWRPGGSRPAGSRGLSTSLMKTRTVFGCGGGTGLVGQVM